MAKFQKLVHTQGDIVSRQEAKLQCQFDDPSAAHDEDSLIDIYISAAISHAEQKIDSVIKEVKYKVLGVSWDDILMFKKARLKSVENVQYRDVDGDLQDLDSSFYSVEFVDEFEQLIQWKDKDSLPDVYDSSDAVQVTMVYGFTEIPEDIKAAILLYVTDMYENRADQPKEKISAADKLLASHKYYPRVE